MDYQDTIFSPYHNETLSKYVNFVQPRNQTEVICDGNITNCRIEGETSVPRELTFNEEQLVSVVAYTCLFVVAAGGNLTVFITLVRNRHIKSRVNLFILHLSVADLIVTFIMLPLEISWHLTVAWKAGDAACRFLMFFRTFGLYLSSFILVTISLDRYFAILHPLSLNDADKRGKIMLILAWSFSTIASIPQSVIFHVERHPQFTWFTQCVTFNFFPTPQHELAYNLFNIITLYGLPLIIITASYSLILFQISKKTRQSKEETHNLSQKSRGRLRRSAVGNIERARTRTLKMTLVIVSVFVMCWTPYFVMSAWWWFDRTSAKKVDPKISKGLYLFAVSNSCMNPIVYGMFTINFKREFTRCCCGLNNAWRKRKLGRMAMNMSVVRQRTSTNMGTSYSIVKSASSPFINNGNIINHSNMAVLSSSNQQSSSSSPRPPYKTTNLTQRTESRANINNFMAITMPVNEHSV